MTIIRNSRVLQVVLLLIMLPVFLYGVNYLGERVTGLTGQAAGEEEFSKATWSCSDGSTGEYGEGCQIYSNLYAQATEYCSSCAEGNCEVVDFELQEMCAPSVDGSVTIFQKPLFDHFLHDVAFTPDEAVDTLKVRLAPGEYEPVSFFVHSETDLNDVTIEYGDATNGTDVIPKENIDIRVVKVWKQGGLEKWVEHPDGIDVPELLVYDDSEDYSDGFHLNDLFLSGHEGNALYFNNMHLNYYSKDRIDTAKGTVDFWVKPDNWDDPVGKRLFEQKDAPTNQKRIYITTDSNGNLVGYYNMKEQGKLVCTGSQLEQGVWSRITFGWDTETNQASLYVNGSNEGVTCNFDDIPAMEPRSTFQIGWYTSSQDAYIDSFRMYSGMFSPDNLDQGELLFSEDFESVMGIKNQGGWFNKPGSQYEYPSPSDTLRTDIPNNTSKQFWITVNAPEGKVGKFSTILRVIRDNQVLKELPLTIDVLPIELQSPRLAAIPKHYGIFFQVQPDFNIDRARNQLQDIKDHGFDSVVVKISGKTSIDMSEDAPFNQTLKLVQEIGFTGPVIVWPYHNEVYESLTSTGELIEKHIDVALIRDMVVSKGLDFYMYGNDEPYLLDPEGVNNRVHNTRHLIAKVDTIRKYDDVKVFNSGVYTAKYAPETYITAPYGYAAIKEFYDPTHKVFDQPDPRIEEKITFRTREITSADIDMVTYNVGKLHDGSRDEKWPGQGTWEWLQSLLEDYESNKDERLDTGYWQSRYELPHYNRYMTGYFNWVYGLNGVYPHTYQTIIDPYGNNDPFNDFDSPGLKRAKDSMTTYPSADGSIPTMQWEQFREGIDDVRYLVTLYALIDELRATDSDKAVAIDNEIKQELERYADPEDIYTLTGAEFENTRKLVTNKILELKGISELTPTPSPTPIPTPSENIISNPGFESGKTSWNWTKRGGTGSFSVVPPGVGSANSAVVKLTKSGSNVQLFQVNIPLKPNTQYKLSFDGKASKNISLPIYLIKHTSPYTNYGLTYSPNLTTSWSNFSTTLTSTSNASADARLRFNFSNKTGTFYVDNVTLQEL